MCCPSPISRPGKTSDVGIAGGRDAHVVRTLAAIRFALSTRRDLLLEMLAELSSRTFWNFVREFSSCRGRHERLRDGGAAPEHGAVRSSQVTAHAARPRHSLQTHQPAGSSWSPAVGGHAAAAMDGHVPQAADRLAELSARTFCTSPRELSLRRRTPVRP